MLPIRPFDPGDQTELDRSWPLASHLLFATTNADGALEGSKDLASQIGLQYGRIHAASMPFGRGRSRTDTSSQYVWTHRARVNVGTRDFTAAAFVHLKRQDAQFEFLFTNGNLAGGTQWRLMPHYNGSGYQDAAFSFFTFDGSVTQVAATGVVIDAPAWYIGVRRGTELQLWRNNVLIATTTGTVRDVTGSNSNPPQQGLYPSGGQASRGYHGPALLFGKALTPTEINLLVSDLYGFVARPARKIIVLPAGGGPDTVNPGTFSRYATPQGWYSRLAQAGGWFDRALLVAPAPSSALAALAQSAATASGALTAQIVLSGQAYAQAVADGGLLAQIALVAGAQSQASAGAALTAQIALAAAAIATATASGTLAAPVDLSGAAIAVTTASGSLTAQIRINAAALAQATAGAVLTTQIVLSGQAASGALASGVLTTQIVLTASALAQAAATGVLTTQIALSGAAAAQAAASGSLAGGAVLQGAALATAAASAGLATQINLQGAAIALVQTTGGLAAQIRLSGDALAQALASATLTSGSGLSGSAASQAAAGATLTVQIRLAGAALGQSAGTGMLTAVIQLSAQALAQAIAAGSLTARIDLAGHAVATIWAGGDLTAAGSMVIPAPRVLTHILQTFSRVATAGARRLPATQTSRR